MTTHMDSLSAIYEGYKSKPDAKLFYFCAHSRFFTPEERGEIQDKVFAFLKKKKIEYVQTAWGYGLFISDKDLAPELEKLVQHDDFAIAWVDVNDDLDTAVQMVDDKLHDGIAGLEG